jgi:hypothetical protein
LRFFRTFKNIIKQIISITNEKTSPKIKPIPFDPVPSSETFSKTNDDALKSELSEKREESLKNIDSENTDEIQNVSDKLRRCDPSNVCVCKTFNDSGNAEETRNMKLEEATGLRDRVGDGL